MSSRTIRSLGVAGPGKMYFLDYEEEPLAEGQMQLDTLYTGFSAGTELTFLKKTNPYFFSRFDNERAAFVPNEPSLNFPVPFLGYMEVARVADSKAKGYSSNDIVATTYGHKTGHTANPLHDVLVQLPAGVAPILGVFVAQMGPIAANGILHADAAAFGASVSYLGCGVAGRRTLVIGAGTVGLLTALFCRSLGASEVLIADPSDFRRAKAEALGIQALDEDAAWQHAKALWHNGGSDRGADVVFQTRAHSQSLHVALKALRPQAWVIDLAFYQSGAGALRLGEEFHHNGLNIHCAQINRVPPGLSAQWDRRRLAEETITLLAQKGDEIRRHLVTHVIPFAEAPEFLSSVLARQVEFLQIVFEVAQ